MEQKERSFLIFNKNFFADCRYFLLQITNMTYIHKNIELLPILSKILKQSINQFFFVSIRKLPTLVLAGTRLWKSWAVTDNGYAHIIFFNLLRLGTKHIEIFFWFRIWKAKQKLCRIILLSMRLSSSLKNVPVIVLLNFKGSIRVVKITVL